MNDRKIYIYIGLFILILVCVIGVIYYFFAKKDSDPIVQGAYPQSVLSAINNPLERVTDSFSNLVVNDKYVISYGGDNSAGTFYITVNAEPVIEVSKVAEQALLEKLNIDEQYACTLYVVLNVPSIVDSNLSEYDFGLSFCPDRPHIEDVPRSTDKSNQYTNDTSSTIEDETFNIR